MQVIIYLYVDWAYECIQFVLLILFRMYSCLYSMSKIMFVIIRPLFSQDGFTPLMIAAREGHLSVVELLVSGGAQVNSQDNVSVCL